MPNQPKPKTESKSSHPKTIEEALARFQMEHHAAGKDGKANYGTYTTLAGGLNAVQPATHLGLSHTQTFEHIVVGEKVVTVLKTRLLFTGEDRDFDTVIESNLPFPDLVPNRGNIMQALGSAITYARRYSLLAIYGLAGDDDDAEGSAPVQEVKPKINRSPAFNKRGQQEATQIMNTLNPQAKPLAELKAELREFPSIKRDRILNRFKNENFPKSNATDPAQIFDLCKSPEHIASMRSIIVEIDSEST